MVKALIIPLVLSLLPIAILATLLKVLSKNSKISSPWFVSSRTTKLSNTSIDKMKYLFQAFFIFCTVIFISCNSKESINTKNIFEKSTLSDSLSFYFPPILNDTFKRPPFYENFIQKWYSSSLYSLKEPILYNKNDSQIIYRLLVLRSFDNPFCFSFKEFEGGYFLNAKSLDRQPSFYFNIIDNGKDGTGREILDTIENADRLAFINFDPTIALRSGQRQIIESYLFKLNFWNSPIADSNDENTTDCSNWIIEGRKYNTYHFIERRNARGQLWQFGKYLIGLSGLKIKDSDIY